MRKITRQELRSIIRGHLRSIKEATKDSVPFGSGMKPADLEPDQKEIVGHT